MSTKKTLIILGTLVLALTFLTACAGAEGATGPAGPAGPAGPEGPAGAGGADGTAGADGASAMATDLTCTECHNDTTIISGKKTAWESSIHGSGTAAAYAGGRGGCEGCHSGGAFKEMIAAGLSPDTFEGGVADVTHQDCRTCHMVHTSYTGDDWALTTNAPVALYAFEDATYDGGQGNLCAVCHQPRRQMEPGVDGMFEITSTHWGPHHGPQSTMLLGIGGAGATEGKPSAHATMVEDGCVTCHLGENDDHTFEPDVAACQGCHADLEDFDLNGAQSEVEAMAAELGELLEAAGLLHDGHPNPGTYTEDQAQAAWNYIYIVLEDKSLGAHNMAYTKAMLEAGLEVMR